MKFKRLSTLLMVSVLIVLSLTACNGSSSTLNPSSSSGTSSDPASSSSASADSDKYTVTEPIKIEWWHAVESQYRPTIDKVISDFQSKNPNITVDAIYQGSYGDIKEKLVAAQAAGTTLPALAVASTPVIAEYGAAWALISYLTSKDVNMVWATETGYMPTRNSVTKTDAAREFLKAKPAFQVIFDHLDDINPTIQHPVYAKLASVWRESLAKAVIEDQDIKASMDNAKKLIDEALADQ